MPKIWHWNLPLTCVLHQLRHSLLPAESLFAKASILLADTMLTLVKFYNARKR